MDLKATTRLALYAQNALNTNNAKTTEGLLRYGSNPIVCVIDKNYAGRNLVDVIKIRHDAPIVDSVEKAASLGASALVIGTATTGGKLQDQTKDDILAALRLDMDVVSGLHDFLADDAQISKVAKERGRRLIDVRKPPDELPIGQGKVIKGKAKRILTVGTDASIGKMTTSIELLNEAKRRDLNAEFIATGQTGIMVAGKGICIDRVIGDFMAGAVEQMVLEADKDCDYIFIEGQGAIGHPGFSGVTLSLLHGSCPHMMVLCHQVIRKTVKNLEFKLPSLQESIIIYEHLANLLYPSRIVAIALDTRGLTEEEAITVIGDTEKSSGLPTNDPIRFDVGNLLDAIVS